MSTSVSAYPARIEGRLDPGLSRWLWLVKWLLLIPHAIVLAFLWISFAFTTVIAFFAILFTGRYPRALFDYGVGVVRWTWRVSFYAFDANGTDRYPPFTLAEGDYPATFEVEYPERLSRGLVLVKWWLLAIPHYLVLAFLLGGAWFAWDGRPAPIAAGLIGVLVLIAVVALLFTGRYPRGIFDLVLGLNRWVLRVAAYALLMTDRYPPFRLDLGPTEGRPVVVGAEAVRAAPHTESGAWGAGRVLAIVGGGLAGLVGVALLAAGIAFVAIDQTQRDSRGFVMTSTERLATPTYAIASERVDTGIDGRDVPLARDILGTVRVRAASTRPIFVGIARSADVDRYLTGVQHEEARDLADIGARTDYVMRPGGRAPAPPAAQSFWVVSARGAGEQALTWKVRDGSWRLVVMNAGGAPRVAADVSVGARLPHLLAYGFGLLGGAVVLLAAGAGLVYLGARGRTTVARRP